MWVINRQKLKDSRGQEKGKILVEERQKEDGQKQKKRKQMFYQNRNGTNRLGQKFVELKTFWRWVILTPSRSEMKRPNVM